MERMWKAAGLAASIGNRLLYLAAEVMILSMLLYGGYSLWENFRIGQSAFVSEELLQYKPGIEGKTEGFAELQDRNPDVKAWLTIAGTHVDYPVLQGETDLDYINRDVYGEFSLSGSVFLSCLNSPDFSDGYSLIYGHHMENGAMFGDITRFAEATYFQEHPKGELRLENETLELELFACLETDAYDGCVYNCGPDADRVALLSYIRAHAVQYRETDVTAEDRILGLSTCADETAETNGRVLIFGRLKEKSESELQI